MQMRSYCIGALGYLPSAIRTNSDLEDMVDTTDEWIVHRTGIKQRHIADEKETSYHMALNVASAFIKQYDVDPSTVDLVIVATTTSDIMIPSIACRIQGELGMTNAAAFDMQAACAGFVYAVSMADNLIKSAAYKSILIIGVDKMSNAVDWSDRNTCVLFGDGAGAILLKVNDSDNDSGIIDSALYSDGTLNKMLYSDGNITASTGFGHIQMLGQDLFRRATSNMKQMILDILDKNGYTLQDISAIVPHQANKRIISAVMKSLGLEESIAIITIDQHSNTSAASIPLSLHHATSIGRIKRGDLIIMEAIGAGLVCGIVLLRW